MEGNSNHSTITHLLNQIEAEYLAAQRGLTGFAESARHSMITARMERLGQFHEQLRVIAGDDAMRLMAERLESISVERRPEE